MQLFFNSLQPEQTEEWMQKGTVGESVSFHCADTLPSWKDADIAIFSVEEYRGSLLNQSLEEDGMHHIRKAFYGLKPFSKSCKLVDLGTMRLGLHLEETYLRLAEVCEQLMEHNTFPLIIGGGHDLDYGQFMGYQNMEKLISVLHVDAYLDVALSKQEGASSHLHQILTHKPNYLFDFAHLGHQRYLSHPKALDTLRSLLFEVKSVGEMRGEMQEVEPTVRMADMISFDLSAIKKVDMPANKLNMPFGLTGEEACQLCWYAGTNDKLSSFGLYEYNSDADNASRTGASVAGIMLWYFVEGFAGRHQERHFSTNFHIKYTVPMQEGKQELVFYKSKNSDRWWMEVKQLPQKGRLYNRNLVVPCSYSDFEAANRGELPERWLKAHAKPV